MRHILTTEIISYENLVLAYVRMCYALGFMSMACTRTHTKECQQIEWFYIGLSFKSNVASSSYVSVAVIQGSQSSFHVLPSYACYIKVKLKCKV